MRWIQLDSSGPKERFGLHCPAACDLIALGLGQGWTLSFLDAWQGQGSQGQRGCISWLEAGAQGFQNKCYLEMTFKIESGLMHDIGQVLVLA